MFAEFDPSLWVLDGGGCQVGIESSIVDCTRGQPVLLRPGVLSNQQLAAVAGQPLLERDAAAPRASGTLESHYAPRARLRLMTGPQLGAALQLLDAGLPTLAVYSRSRLTGVGAGLLQRRMPVRADDAARELYAALRELDADGVQLIWVEQPPADPAWDGVRDRLQRAAAS